MPNPWYDHRGHRHDRPDVGGAILKIIGAATMGAMLALILEAIIVIVSS